MDINQIENRNNPAEEPVDTSTFLNNNFFLVAADKFWTHACSPVINFFQGLKEAYTRNWVDNQLNDIDERREQQEAVMAQALKDAEEYRNGQH
jgi:hypothetical protein